MRSPPLVILFRTPILVLTHTRKKNSKCHKRWRDDLDHDNRPIPSLSRSVVHLDTSHGVVAGLGALDVASHHVSVPLLTQSLNCYGHQMVTAARKSPRGLDAGTSFYLSYSFLSSHFFVCGPFTPIPSQDQKKLY